MAKEVLDHGSYTHGTKNENVLRTNSEYSITLKTDSKLALEWKQKYYCNRLYDALISQ